MWNKCRNCRRGRRVFKKEELKESIKMIKELRMAVNQQITNPENSSKYRESLEKIEKNYDTAIDAMNEILFDL